MKFPTNLNENNNNNNNNNINYTGNSDNYCNKNIKNKKFVHVLFRYAKF